MFDPPIHLTRPGLFITGTDTGVGKTAVTCGIAWQLRQQGLRVGVCKPLATGCRREREGLVSDDAEALAHFADCREPLDVINPLRYRKPLAPAAAAQQQRMPADFQAIARSLDRLSQVSDVLLVEGVGGLLVPIDAQNPRLTVLDLAVAIHLPVLIVTRAGLGTLNHTAMTVRLLRQAGCPLAGLVVNGYEYQVPDLPNADGKTVDQLDLSMASNRLWLERMNRLSILATVPRVTAIQPEKGQIPPAFLDALGHADWMACIRAAADR